MKCKSESGLCIGGLCNQKFASDSSLDFWLENIILRQVGDRGVGAFARKAMENGTNVGELAGRLLPNRQDKQETFYNTKISIGTSPNVNYAVIDLKHTASVTRYLNHSCVPNCTFWEGRCGNGYRLVWVQTTRAIAQGKELTVHYGPGWFESPDEYCLCG